MKLKVVITGENGYIGNMLYEHLKDNTEVSKVSVRNGFDTEKLTNTDVVIHAAALVHKKDFSDEEYKKVNLELTEELAKSCKTAGVGRFIFISTMAVFGKEKMIVKNTIPKPENMYGISKLKAEESVLALKSDSFCVTVIRPPMVYGANCPGNYSRLKKLARYAPIFPNSGNKRSMISIENLCIFIQNVIIGGKDGKLHPQDPEYVNTGIMYKKIREQSGKKTILIPLKILKFVNVPIIQKIFGDEYYSKDMDD